MDKTHLRLWLQVHRLSSPRLLHGRAASYGSLIIPGEVIAKGRCRLLIYAAVSLAVRKFGRYQIRDCRGEFVFGYQGTVAWEAFIFKRAFFFELFLR